MINLDYIDLIEEDKDLESTSKEEVVSTEDVVSEEKSKEAASAEEVASEEKSKEVVSAEEVAPEEESKEVASAEEVSPEEESKEVASAEKVAPEEETKEAASDKEEIAVEKNNGKKDVEFIFTNIIGKKIGMTQLFSDEGNVFPATIIEAGPCSVTQIKNIDTDGYKSVQIGYDNVINKDKVNKASIGHFNKSKSTPKKVLKEFRVDNDKNLPQLGDVIDVNQFNPGEFITVTGYSIGKGFAGHMKRHGFGGGRASHGKNSVMRKAGSVGAGTSPGRIFPGMKMAGRMGNDKVTTKNLQILDIDYDSNLIFVKGSVPGSKNNYIFLRKS